MKILIADDDPQILRALRITLTARGYEIVTASDGRSALNAAIEHHPDLVVLDLGMPGLTGIEVTQADRRPGRHVQRLGHLEYLLLPHAGHSCPFTISDDQCP